MSSLPKRGLYVSTKKVEGMRFIVEDAYGENPEEFYIVELIDEASKNDPLAMGDELDKHQWESMCAEFGLKYQSI